MEISEYIPHLLTAIGLFVSLKTLYAGFFNKNISEERIKWREKIRELSQEIIISQSEPESKKLKLYCELANRLNPTDEADKNILELCKEILNEQPKERKIEEFINKTSLLLKDDWERCKHESKLRSIIFCCKYKSKYKKSKKEYKETN
ncbi:hypothetical protein NSA18_03585 [Pasteurella caecimuris]|uniref:hypothetical protein n=1 Tax=Rodentibacter caecimuris TaxID=1796644 RepID=UPI00214FF1CC|nr:hypothetical protein [Pasteurella caecimuris]MCR1836995.1 hypothetical protein [Pasteurella caecimuris]MCU0107021.1 hypothetical protein [Pasteurella caecimuris]